MNIDEFIDKYAVAHDLTMTPKNQLRNKLQLLEQWSQKLVQLIGILKTYKPNHPTPKKKTAELLEFAKKILPITLKLGAFFVSTEEGYPLRQKRNQRYIFLPFFRDGIRKITLISAEKPEEFALLLEVLSSKPREEDNAVTWLWSGRLKTIRIEVAPWYPPNKAAALHVIDPKNKVFGAYVETFLAAAISTKKKRQQKTIPNHLLLTPEQIESFLQNSGQQSKRLLQNRQLDERVKQRCRALFSNENDLEHRTKIIQKWVLKS